MKVSVLVATRHRPEWLSQLIRSIADQTCNLRDVETVVVHDGTPGIWPDRPGDSPYLGQGYPYDRPDWSDKSLVYLEQQHAGKSTAINLAFARSRGRYVTVMDDDDLMHPNKLAMLAQTLDKDQTIDVAYGLPRYVDITGQVAVQTPAMPAEFVRDFPVYTWAMYCEHRRWGVHSTSSMYRRELWDRVGLWDPGLPTCEEWEFNMRCLAHGATFAGLEAVTDYYRVHPGQKSGRRRRQLATRHAIKQEINDRINSWVKAGEGW